MCENSDKMMIHFLLPPFLQKAYVSQYFVFYSGWWGPNCASSVLDERERERESGGEREREREAGISLLVDPVCFVSDDKTEDS